MTLFEDLKWRGLIKDIAGEESELQKVLDGTPFTFYWGTDPTADSLHIGHYSSLCMAKRLANAGHHPILLCGGATGRIGDPRPTAEREIISEETSKVYSDIEKGFMKLEIDILDNKINALNSSIADVSNNLQATVDDIEENSWGNKIRKSIDQNNWG